MQIMSRQLIRISNIFVFRYRYLQHRFVSTNTQARYFYPRLDNVEDLEKYRPGGFHPVSIADEFAGGRYKILHKLGYGGSSTVWLAQDQRLGNLISLRVMSAEESSKYLANSYRQAQLEIDKFSHTLNHPGRKNLPVVMDHFLHQGPNGSHLCLISTLAGPSVLSMAECPGRVSGSRRLRGDLARKVAKKMASAVELLHFARIIHGDLTSSNIVFQSRNRRSTREGSAPGPHAPLQIVAPIDLCPLLLKEDIFLIDFGQSFVADHPPPHNVPAIPLHYLSIEAFYDRKISFASDVWALACTIFEIRAGLPLFDPFIGSEDLILKQIVETLGKFPDPWWSAWEARQTWFDDVGAPKPEDKQGSFLIALKGSLCQTLREIGGQDDAPDVDGGIMIEKVGTRLDGVEIELLADLLEKMLKYNPKERISMSEVVHHPWFTDSR